MLSIQRLSELRLEKQSVFSNNSANNDLKTIKSDLTSCQGLARGGFHEVSGENHSEKKRANIKSVKLIRKHEQTKKVRSTSEWHEFCSGSDRDR